jgi:hypothetical protein
MEASMVVLVVEERNLLIPAQKGCQALAKNDEMNHGGTWCGRYLLPALQLVHSCSNTTDDSNPPPTMVGEPLAVQMAEE